MTEDATMGWSPTAVQPDSIIALADGTRVHLTPEQCYVRSIGRRTGRRDLWVVNQTAGRLFAACDGERSVSAIVAVLEEQVHGHLDVAEACAFFDSAVSHGHIKALSSPRPDPTQRVTGSLDCFIPLHIAVELTAACNLSCSYCYNSFDQREQAKQSLPVDALLGILERWRQRGLMGVELTGGEPLLYDGFWEIFDYAAEHFEPFAILTNGLLVDDEAADRLATAADKLVVSVSLDGPTAHVHERTRGKGTFDRVVAAIRRLTSRGIAVRPAMTVDQGNIMELERTVELAKELGAKFFGYAPVSPFGRGEGRAWKWDWRRAEDIAELEARVIDANRGFIAVVDDPESRGPHEVNCGAGHKNVVLSPTGKITHCLFADRSVYLGDVLKHSIDDVFSQPIFRFLNQLPEPSFESCANCHYALFCRGCSMRPLTVFARERQICQWAVDNDVLRWIAPDLRDLPRVCTGRF